jgi:hypothetical protein
VDESRQNGPIKNKIQINYGVKYKETLDPEGKQVAFLKEGGSISDHPDYIHKMSRKQVHSLSFQFGRHSYDNRNHLS